MNYDSLYQRLITKRQTNPPDLNQYHETHHIIPRCLGGMDDLTNLVKLTAREHFLAHWLLVKININQPIHILSKLASAFNKMCSSNNHPGRKFTSKQYEIARKIYSQYHPMKNIETVNKNITTRKIKQNIKLIEYNNSLPLCLCGCGEKVKKHDRKYLYNHWNRSELVRQGFNPEIRQHLSQVAKQRINNLDENIKKERLLRSLHSPHIDHKKRGEKISESKRGKSTNQQYIMGTRLGKMSESEFATYLASKSYKVHTRFKKLRQQYITNDN